MYTKLAKVEQQIQVHSIYPHNTIDEVQLEALAYNPIINGYFKQQGNSTSPKEIHSPPSIQSPEAAQQNSDRTEGTSTNIQATTTKSSPEQNRTEQINSNQELDQEED